MSERFAVVFRVGDAATAGALEVGGDRLVLRGRRGADDRKLEVPFSELAEVRVGRRPEERVNGYATLVLERRNMPPVQVAPFGVALVREIAHLLGSLSQRTEADRLTVVVPLRPGCLARARSLLAKGPPIDPASLGIESHEVYLHEEEAVFVFRGADVRDRVSQFLRHPAVWRAGVAWQRCVAGPPRIVGAGELILDAAPAYSWTPDSVRSLV